MTEPRRYHNAGEVLEERREPEERAKAPNPCKTCEHGKKELVTLEHGTKEVWKCEKYPENEKWIKCPEFEVHA